MFDYRRTSSLCRVGYRTIRMNSFYLFSVACVSLQGEASRVSRSEQRAEERRGTKTTEVNKSGSRKEKSESNELIESRHRRSWPLQLAKQTIIERISSHNDVYYAT